MAKLKKTYAHALMNKLSDGFMMETAGVTQAPWGCSPEQAAKELRGHMGLRLIA